MNSAQLPETVSIIDQTNNLDPITDISIDSESQIPNCEISCLHCIEIIRKNHLIQIANNNFETDLFKNNPLITKFVLWVKLLLKTLLQQQQLSSVSLERNLVKFSSVTAS